MARDLSFGVGGRADSFRQFRGTADICEKNRDLYLRAAASVCLYRFLYNRDRLRLMITAVHLIMASLSRFLLECGKNHSTSSGLEYTGNRGFHLLTEKSTGILNHNHSTVI